MDTVEETCHLEGRISPGDVLLFEARLVVPVMDAVRVEQEAIAFRDGLPRK